MIRKAIIVVLTLGAVGTGAIGVVSFRRTWTWGSNPGRFDHTGRIRLNLQLLAGTVHVQRLRFLRSDESIQAPQLLLDVGGFAFGTKTAIGYVGLGNLPVSPPYRAKAREAGHLTVVGYHVAFIQLSLWAPFILFAAYPTIAFIRGPLRRWRRRRKGLCVKCGYNLTGNVTGTCSECGGTV